MRIVRQIGLPTGLLRRALRVPIYAYRFGLGWLFGSRLLLLNHVGRVSGKRRRTVLEVVEHDTRDGSYVVASGWGAGASWYRNVVQQPQVMIQVGRQTIPAVAITLPNDEGADVFAEYAARHRMLARHLLPRLMGFSVDGSEADFREVGRRLPFVRFVPRTGSGQ